jgi:hypothetical protein
VTAFMQKCMPYVKYTYRWPGSPNITAFRAVRPLKAWLAGSSGSYASVSTIRAATLDPSPDRATRILPRRSGATSDDRRA